MEGNSDKSVNFILDLEGGEVDDKTDKGGHTKYGISQNAYPDVDIANLTIDDAKAIYKRDYWDKCKCDELPSGVDFLVFDFGVNSGTGTAIKTLQKVLGKYVTNIVPDGFIGHMTIDAADKCGKAIIKDLLNERRIFYSKIVTLHPDQEKFLKGWLTRVDKLANEVKTFI